MPDLTPTAEDLSRDLVADLVLTGKLLSVGTIGMRTAWEAAIRRALAAEEKVRQVYAFARCHFCETLIPRTDDMTEAIKAHILACKYHPYGALLASYRSASDRADKAENKLARIRLVATLLDCVTEAE